MFLLYISGVNLFLGEENTIGDDAIRALAARGIRETHPKSNKYVFTRDIRHRIPSLYQYPTELISQFAMMVKCPHLVVRATRWSFGQEEEIEKIRHVYEQCNPDNIHVAVVEGNHAVHLTHPEDVWHAIQPFLEKKHESKL